MKQPDIIPQAMAARVVGVTRSYVNIMTKKGQIKTFNVYAEKWVSLKEVRRFLATRNGRKGQAS